MKIVYIAGPYTGPNAWAIEQNVRKAEEVGLYVAECGAMPIIPHTNTRFFHGLLTPEFWYEGTLELLRRADALMMVPGWEHSTGAKAERLEAERLLKLVFYFGDGGSEQAFEKWLLDEHR